MSRTHRYSRGFATSYYVAPVLPYTRPALHAISRERFRLLSLPSCIAVRRRDSFSAADDGDDKVLQGTVYTGCGER